MFKSVVKLVLLISLSLLTGILRFFYHSEYLEKWFYTIITFTILFFVFRLFFGRIVAKRIKNKKARYSFRKASYFIFPVVVFFAILRVWVVDPQILTVAYGLMAAGVTIALRDLFKNFAGGIMIFFTGLYHVGDRIEIKEKRGDVVDIGILYTTLLETGEWVEGDQPTGRLSILPNGDVLSSVVNNYTRDHEFLWDEISFPITYESNWEKASDLVIEIAEKETKEISLIAEKSLSNLNKRFYLDEKNMKPSVFVDMTDNWVNLTLRYVVESRGRRFFRSCLVKIILKEIEKQKDIEIASTTLTLNEDSKISIKKEN